MCCVKASRLHTHIHTYTRPSICNSSMQADRWSRAIVATVAIFNPAQRRFFFLLVWRRDLRTPVLPIYFIVGTSSTQHNWDDNAKERESTKPSSINCIPPSNTGADGTHGSSRRTTRTAPQEDLNAPRRSVQCSFRILTTRVGLSPP